jgi:hypothetical protein
MSDYTVINPRPRVYRRRRRRNPMEHFKDDKFLIRRTPMVIGRSDASMQSPRGDQRTYRLTMYFDWPEPIVLDYGDDKKARDAMFEQISESLKPDVEVRESRELRDAIVELLDNYND